MHGLLTAGVTRFTCRPRSAALAPRHTANAPSPFRLGAYLAKRSQLVADLADQVQDHACKSDGPPIWAAAGTHYSALVGEIAVWRAANGINPQDPRPTGETQLETLPALWKQRLDRDIACATDPPADARADERQSGRTAPTRSYGDRQRPYERPERPPRVHITAAPADGPLRVRLRLCRTDLGGPVVKQHTQRSPVPPDAAQTGAAFPTTRPSTPDRGVPLLRKPPCH